MTAEVFSSKSTHKFKMEFNVIHHSMTIQSNTIPLMKSSFRMLQTTHPHSSWIPSNPFIHRIHEGWSKLIILYYSPIPELKEANHGSFPLLPFSHSNHPNGDQVQNKTQIHPSWCSWTWLSIYVATHHHLLNDKPIEEQQCLTRMLLLQHHSMLHTHNTARKEET